MEYIKGKYKSSIFDGNAGYKVGLFRVSDSSDELSELINHTVTFNGNFVDLNMNDQYVFYGQYIHHEKYGYQFSVKEYEKIEPTGKEQVIEFFTSPFVKGCGEKTAKKIVDVLGENAISLIKEDKNNLVSVGLSESTTNKIYTSIMNYYDSDEVIMYLRSLDLSVNEITKLINLYGAKNVKKIMEEDLYSLIDIIDFKKLDQIFFRIYDETNDMRIIACIIQSLKDLNFEYGDTYSFIEEIEDYMIKHFNIMINNLDDYINILVNRKQIKIVENKYYLMETYQDELYISKSLIKINNSFNIPEGKIDSVIDEFQDNINIKYNEEQREAIKSAIINNITVITGGPGTGKTTIINGILNVYKELNRFRETDMLNNVALLAPTGRASKRMSEATYYPAMTIHRYLKWNRELKEFAVNEYNRNNHKLIIIDEVSMIDNALMAALLRGIDHSVKLVLVGDEHQLPSVGPGNVLKDIIESNMFNYISLNNIYRQSENSFIPILAREIKNKNIESNILDRKDDYNFLKCESREVKSFILSIINKSVKKGLTEKDMQVLIPMYKGENGIDSLNEMLQEVFNPKDDDKEELKIGTTIYRVGDKVINLVNNVECNIFNGDIGYITDINPKKSDEFMEINFDGNVVFIKRDEVMQLKHAYALSIHKSQGSEFNHVIMPIVGEYKRMLYNKLLYTGVSRAKKSLVLVGDDEAFLYAVNNNYSYLRKTTLFMNNNN